MKLALVGYGEVGRILAEDLRAAGHEVAAFDVKLDGVAGRAMRAHARAHGVRLGRTHAGALEGAELVLSAVTADQTVAVAQACGGAFFGQAFFLDLNSASLPVRDAGLPPWSAGGTVELQAWMAGLSEQDLFGVRGEAGFARSSDWRIEADRILDRSNTTSSSANTKG